MKKNYFEQLDFLLNNISLNTNLSKRHVNILRGDSIVKLKNISLSHSFMVSEAILDFFSKVGSFQINWTLNDTISNVHFLDKELDFYSGEANIVDFHILLNGPKGEGWMSELVDYPEMSIELQEELTTFLPFDFIKNEWAVGFKINKDNLQDELFFYSYSDEQITSLKIGIEKYVQLLIKCRAFAYWPKAFIEQDSKERLNLIHYLPQIFPETKDSLSSIFSNCS